MIDKLAAILATHRAWLYGEANGSRANLIGANLSGADLSRANLSRASLIGANLSGADLSRANLIGANLIGASLSGANLIGADLSRANLIGANLIGASLSGANLSGADLSGANLIGASLSGANLSGADLSRANLIGANLIGASLSGANLSGASGVPAIAAAQVTIVPDGELIAWKKCRGGVVVKLKIPADAKRSNASGRKCRAEFADVLEVIGADFGVSLHDGVTKYTAGQRVTCDKWCEDRWQECAGGIHFFITKAEAEEYSG